MRRFDFPCTVVLTFDTLNVLPELGFHTFLLQISHHLPRQHAEIDIRTFCGKVCRNRLTVVSAAHNQRSPIGNLVPIGRKFHIFKKFLGFKRVITFLKIRTMVFIHHQRHMRHGIDERIVFQLTFRNQRRPKLAADMELFGNIEGTRRIDNPICTQRRVIQLAQGGMPRTRIIPCIRRLQSHIFQPFNQGNFPRRFEFLQQHAQSGAHDTSTHQHNVCCFSHGSTPRKQAYPALMIIRLTTNA